MIFKSNPQFIFHDSRGFESGSIEETERVKAFIAKHAASYELSKQLHAIWSVILIGLKVLVQFPMLL